MPIANTSNASHPITTIFQWQSNADKMDIFRYISPSLFKTNQETWLIFWPPLNVCLVIVLEQTARNSLRWSCEWAHSEKLSRRCWKFQGEIHKSFWKVPTSPYTLVIWNNLIFYVHVINFWVNEKIHRTLCFWYIYSDIKNLQYYDAEDVKILIMIARMRREDGSRHS